MIIIDPVAITTSALVSTNVPAENPQYRADGVYALGELVNYDSGEIHNVYQQLQGVSKTVAITTGTPALIVLASHGLAAGQPVKLTTTGGLPTGLTAGATYYVVNPTTGNFQLAATPGGSAIAATGGQSGTHTLTINAIGKPVTDTTYWGKVSARNAWKMFDEFNNTATENPESITVVLAPGAICRGALLVVEGSSLEVSMTDPVDGLVHSQTQSLLVSNSGSSYYNWMFNRIVRRKVAIALGLPPYARGQITITIRNPGGIAKCSMCRIGPVLDVGLSQYGISRGIKDYSAVTIAPTGEDATVVRGFARTMSLDILVPNGEVDTVIEMLEQYRQRSVVWVGSSRFKHTAVVGVFESFQNVIQDNVFSKCSVSIRGKV
ncbi:hypothetical protein ACLB1G_21940 [Oxalobacteraceae bacterium A2-2]